MDTFTKNSLVMATLSKPEVVERLKRWLEEKKGLSLDAFAGFVCTALGLFFAPGQPQLASCAEALKELDKKGLISLCDTLDYVPAPSRRHPTPRCLDGPVPEPVDVPSAAGQVRGLRLELVATPEQIKIFNTILRDNHYIGPKIFFGRQIRYVVVSEHGYLGAAGFACASHRSKPRDVFIGWTDSQRSLLRDRILVGMVRFCLLKSVHCRNLATKVLSMALESLRKDFPAKYGYCPCLVETFVDPEYYAGTCYRAGGWVELGLTSGRAEAPRDGGRTAAGRSSFSTCLTRTSGRSSASSLSIPSGTIPRSQERGRFPSILP